MQHASPQMSTVHSAAQLHGVSGPVQQPSPQASLQSDEQSHSVSPPEHTPSPQVPVH
jgi:hypothetical protein